MLAEKEGFEPSNPFTGYTISSRAPSTKLGDFSIGSACVNVWYYSIIAGGCQSVFFGLSIGRKTALGSEI